MEGEHKIGVTREKHQRTELRTAGLMGVLDGVGRLSQWCLPLDSANMLGKKKEPGYT